MALVFQRTRKAWVSSLFGKHIFFTFSGPNSFILNYVEIAENSKKGLKIIVFCITLKVKSFCCKVQEVLAHPVYAMVYTEGDLQ